MRLISWRQLGKKITIAILLGATIQMSVDAMDFMKVNDVHMGMQGIAKTVEHGDDISTFDVKVLGIMKDRGPSGDLILAEFSGPVIERSGGIAHGMSGSPVYIDGKLVGAVAYGWGFTRSHIGMITPIEQMVKLWNVQYTKNSPNPWASDTQLLPLGTPLMAYGFEPEALSYLKTKLPGYKFETYETAAGPNDNVKQPLVAGGSVAATLVDCDLKLGAIGTVTYVDGDKIVAFGHPYLKEGAANYFMHNAYILSIVNSQQSSFKLGTIGATVGTVTEDRGAGISGVVGMRPKAIPMNISITDKDLGRERKANVSIIRDNKMTPSLASTSVYNFINKTMDRRGGGTATVSYTIHTGNKNLADYNRKDMFYSLSSIAFKSIDKFYDIIDRLINNSFVDYDVDGIDVNVSVQEKRKTAQILDATAYPIIAAPGDEIHITVNLHPYDGKKIEKQLVFTVPKDQKPGDITLEVRGGGETPLPYLIQRQKLNLTDEVIRRLHVYKDFETYFKRLKNMDQNNQIIVEILEDDVSMVDSPDSNMTSAKLTSLGNKPSDGVEGLTKGVKNGEWDAFDGDENRAILNTEYIIKGDGQFSVKIVPVEDRDKELAALIAKRTKEYEEKEAKEKDSKPTIQERIEKAKQKAKEKVEKEEKKEKSESVAKKTEDKKDSAN